MRALAALLLIRLLLDLKRRIIEDALTLELAALLDLDIDGEYDEYSTVREVYVLLVHQSKPPAERALALDLTQVELEETEEIIR
jgi:hypothetical protein